MTLRELKVGQSAIITAVGGTGAEKASETGVEAGRTSGNEAETPRTRKPGREKPCASISWTWELFRG